MRKSLILPLLAAQLFAAACSDTTVVDTRPLVRFFNAIPDLAGNGGFTTNGQFAPGSALATGQATQTCLRIDPGSTSFGFGSANGNGTGLISNTLATLNDQSLIAGGNYILVAAGSAASPALYLFDNALTGTLSANQAAVRFVNLAPGTGSTPSVYFVFLGEIGTTIVAPNLAVGIPSSFASLVSGASTFSVLRIPGHEAVIASSTASLPAGSVNTMAIVPNTSGGVELTNLASCS